MSGLLKKDRALVRVPYTRPDGTQGYALAKATPECMARCCAGSFRLFVNCCGDTSSFSRRWHPSNSVCSGTGAPIGPGSVIFIGAICFRATDDVRAAADIPPTDPVSMTRTLPCVAGCDEPPCPDCEPDCCWVTILDTDCDLDVQEETARCNCGEDFEATWDWQARIEYHLVTSDGFHHDYVYIASGHHVEATTRNRDAEPQCLFNRQRSGYIDFEYTDTNGPSASGRMTYPLPPPEEELIGYLDGAGCGTIPYFLHVFAEALMRLNGLSYVIPSVVWGSACETYPAPGPCNRTCSRVTFDGPPDNPTGTNVFNATFSGGAACLGSAPIVNASQSSINDTGQTVNVTVHIEHVLSVNVIHPCGGSPSLPNVPSGSTIRPGGVGQGGTGRRCAGCGGPTRLPQSPAEADEILRD